MMDVKQEVRQFYDEIGWQKVAADVYQNARYEDLRPVSRRYIHDCHLRVARHLQPKGRFLLDAGSGPVQYPEYLEYSHGYRQRVCVDISITALKEARRRIGQHGLFVVADIANLPFPRDVFEGVVSLHTIHHLPEAEHLRAFQELQRVLAVGCQGVIVNGWSRSRLMDRFEPLVRIANSLRHFFSRFNGRNAYTTDETEETPPKNRRRTKSIEAPVGTYTNKHDAAWVKSEVGARMPVQILVWRSVTVRFMRALIHPALGGSLWLRLLYWLEERAPEYYGENGKYALIVIRKKDEG